MSVLSREADILSVAVSKVSASPVFYASGPKAKSRVMTEKKMAGRR